MRFEIVAKKDEKGIQCIQMRAGDSICIFEINDTVSAKCFNVHHVLFVTISMSPTRTLSLSVPLLLLL